MSAEDKVLSQLASRAPREQARVLQRLSGRAYRELTECWPLFAHPGQLAPAGDWTVWLSRAGRGFGKTRAGAEWVCDVARNVPGARIALVGACVEDVVKVMIRGSSGLLNVAHPDQKAQFNATAGTVTFANDAAAHVYSAAAPEKLRGPEHHAAWCDELGKWKQGDAWGPAAWDNLMLGLRAGDQGRCVVTTTPRSTPLMQRVRAMPGLVETWGRTRDNPHLSAPVLAAMTARYAGTRLGRQELDGEFVEDVADALWTRAMLIGCRVTAVPPLSRVVVGVDPPASAGGDACGIVACGIAGDGTGYVLEDASVAGLRPEGWARAVAACAARHGADRVVAEKNNGGDMVRSVLAAADAGLPVKLVHASNEALTLIDLLLHGAVVAVGVDVPPSAPVAGDCWIVGAAPSGAWAGRGGMVAGWTAGGWRFVAPREGMTLWSGGYGGFVRHVGGVWTVGALRGQTLHLAGAQVVGARRPAIADPAGGGTVDAEARAAVGAVLNALRGHGLIAA